MIIKAVRATIKLGDIEIVGYQLPDGTYKVSQQTFKDTLDSLIGNSTGKKYLKPLLDNSSSMVDAVKVEGYNRPIKMYGLDTFSEGVSVYAKLGNKKAVAILVACMSEALERRFDTAFGIVRSEEERNTRMQARIQSKYTRRTLTDSIKEYIERHPELSENYSKFIYSNCSDHTNLTVLGAKSKQVKVELDLKPTGLLRDTIPLKSLREIEAIEMVAGRLIDAEDVEPLEATKKASQIMHAKTLGFQ